REGQASLAVVQVNQFEKPLVVQVVQGVMRKIEIVFRHDPKGADGGQRPAVLAVQAVHSVAVDDQFALIAAREVKVAHQRGPRIVLVPVARVVHARPFVAAIARVAWIIPSSIGHGFLRCMRSWVVREDALAVAARGGSGSAEAPGRVAAAFVAWSYGNHGSGPWAPDCGFSPRGERRSRAAVDQKTA